MSVFSVPLPTVNPFSLPKKAFARGILVVISFIVAGYKSMLPYDIPALPFPSATLSKLSFIDFNAK